MTFSFWGNFDLPLRLDLNGSFGSAFAMWRVASDDWLAYYPGEKKAYEHDDPYAAMLRLGIKAPFDLQELAFLIAGCWEKILPREFARAEYIPGRGWKYYLPQSARISDVVLDSSAGIRSLSGKVPLGWSLSIEESIDFEDKELPGILVLHSGRQDKVVLNIKQVHMRESKWPKENLRLKLPPGTKIVPMQGMN